MIADVHFLHLLALIDNPHHEHWNNIEDNLTTKLKTNQKEKSKEAKTSKLECDVFQKAIDHIKEDKKGAGLWNKSKAKRLPCSGVDLMFVAPEVRQ